VEVADFGAWQILIGSFQLLTDVHSSRKKSEICN
jgi:hypothetical protein